MAKLVEIGALLVAFKGITEETENPTGAAKCLEFSRETLADLERKARDTDLLPEVELPGGVTLAYALACVAMVENALPTEPSAN